MGAADKDVPMTRDLCRSVLPTGLAIIAYALAFIGCVQCNVIKFTSTDSSNVRGVGLDHPITVQFGFWSHEDVNFYMDSRSNYTYAVLSCTKYDDDINIESKWMAAGVFSILPLIIVGLNFILMCVKKCGDTDRWFTCVAYLLAFLFQGLSLLFLDTSACKNNPIVEGISDKIIGLTFQETCSISTGMKCIISAMVFCLVPAFASAESYWARMQKDKKGIPITEPLIGDSVLY